VRRVTFKLDEDVLKRLDELAEERRTVRSAIIRWAIEEYLERNRTVLQTKHIRIYPNIHIKPSKRSKRRLDNRMVYKRKKKNSSWGKLYIPL